MFVFFVFLPSVLFPFVELKLVFLDVYISTKIRFIINVISLETFVKLISLSHFLSRVPSLCLRSSSTLHGSLLAALRDPNPHVVYSIRHKHRYICFIYHSSIVVISSLIHKIVLIFSLSQENKMFPLLLLCYKRDLKELGF